MEYEANSIIDSNNYIKKLLDSNKAFIISRLGIGQETVTTYNVMACGRYSEGNARIISTHNGIYCNNNEDLITYCKFYDKAIGNSDGLALWEPPLVNDIIIPQNYFCNKYKHLSHININILEPYRLIDNNIEPWTYNLLGKKVLIISPFIESFKKQIDNGFELYNVSKKKLFLSNQVFKFYKSYNSLAGNRPHNNWLETYITMCKEINKIDFDIALLGCGGYGLPLCNYIKSKLDRSAIYIGGSLQLLFGVIGSRWLEEEYWKNKIKEEDIKFIKPLDREKIKNYDKIEGGCYW